MGNIRGTFSKYGVSRGSAFISSTKSTARDPHTEAKIWKGDEVNKIVTVQSERVPLTRDSINPDS